MTLPLTASFISAGILALPGNIGLPSLKLFSIKSLRVSVRHVVAVISVTALAITASVNVRPYFDDEAPEYALASQWLSEQAKYSNVSVMETAYSFFEQ